MKLWETGVATLQRVIDCANLPASRHRGRLGARADRSGNLGCPVHELRRQWHPRLHLTELNLQRRRPRSMNSEAPREMDIGDK